MAIGYNQLNTSGILNIFQIVLVSYNRQLLSFKLQFKLPFVKKEKERKMLTVLLHRL